MLAFLPGEFHGQGSLAGYGQWNRKELDMTKQLSNNKLVIVVLFEELGRRS